MILSRIRAGEREAFESLVRETWDDLVDCLAWILPSRDAAEDVSQEAFMRLWEWRERWHGESARALIFRIARNLALDVKRKERVRQKWAARSAGILEARERTDEVVECSEIEHRLREALATLAPGRRAVVESVRLGGLTHREAAEALGISRQTVANRMTLALADLRILLADMLPGEEVRSPSTTQRMRYETLRAQPRWGRP